MKITSLTKRRKMYALNYRLRKNKLELITNTRTVYLPDNVSKLQLNAINKSKSFGYNIVKKLV
jgi:hypothetical protein